MQMDEHSSSASDAAIAFPAWLRAQLAERKLAAGDLAIVLGTDLTVVSEWLAGREVPAETGLDGLAGVLGLDRADLQARVEAYCQSELGPQPRASDPFKEVLSQVEAQAADL